MTCTYVLQGSVGDKVRSTDVSDVREGWRDVGHFERNIAELVALFLGRFAVPESAGLGLRVGERVESSLGSEIALTISQVADGLVGDDSRFRVGRAVNNARGQDDLRRCIEFMKTANSGENGARRKCRSKRVVCIRGVNHSVQDNRCGLHNTIGYGRTDTLQEIK